MAERRSASACCGIRRLSAAVTATMLPLIFICTGEPTEMNRSEALCRAITSSSWLKGLLVLPGLVPLMVFAYPEGRRPEGRRAWPVRIRPDRNQASAPRSRSLMAVLARVWASTRFTMTAHARLTLPSFDGRLPGTTTDPEGTRP